MKEINIAKRLIDERHKKGIRQDELAEYIGVSKAAVSKWESDKSYPDITLLPQLAAYFNISIDELIGYEPQMVKEDIKKLYHRLSANFADKPFDEVMDECDSIIKKYYSCFPLLLQMVVLLVNHASISKNANDVLQKAADLSARVKNESEDVNDAKEASLLEAVCYIMMQQPEKALNLQDENIRPMLNETELLAQTYQMMGNNQKSKEVWQINIYQHLLFLIGDEVCYLMLYTDNFSKAQEIINRILAVADIYNLNKLHPATMASVYVASAQVYCSNKNTDDALDMLDKYVTMCINDFLPFTLHGDSFFDSIDNWFLEFDIGNKAPRNEKLIKESLLQCIIGNPAFSILSDHPRYKSITDKLKHYLGGNKND